MAAISENATVGLPDRVSGEAVLAALVLTTQPLRRR